MLVYDYHTEQQLSSRKQRSTPYLPYLSANQSQNIVQPRLNVHAPCFSDFSTSTSPLLCYFSFLCFLRLCVLIFSLSVSGSFIASPFPPLDLDTIRIITPTDQSTAYTRRNGRHTFSDAEAFGAQGTIHAQNRTLARHRTICDIFEMGFTYRNYYQHTPGHDRAQLNTIFPWQNPALDHKRPGH